MSAKPSLKALMNHGYWGNTFLEGIPPIHVEQALNRIFERVDTVRLPGAWNLYEFEFQCFDAQDNLRLKVQYGWNFNGWVYQPIAIRKRTKLARPGDVVYQPDGGYRIAA